MVKMNDNTILDIAKYIIETKCTLRFASKKFGLPKSTIHYALKKKLKNLNEVLFLKLNKLFSQNFSEKHIRGGEATKNKYKKTM